MSGCFVVVGELPEPHEEGSSGSGSGSGGNSGSAGSGNGGTSGASASGGADGSTVSGGAGGVSGSGGDGGSDATGGDSGVGAVGGTSATGGVSGTAGAGGTGGCCDCDRDGVPALGACGGDDCDDTNDLVFPGQPLFFPTPTVTGEWDYDCSGVPERESEQVTNCGVVDLECTAKPQGWLASAPACGERGRWGKCKVGTGGLTCVEDVLEQNKLVRCH